MITGKEKRKRKEKSERKKEEFSDEEDKYLAYKKKTPKKDDKKNVNESEPSISFTDDTTEKLHKKIKKKKRSNSRDIQSVPEIVQSESRFENGTIHFSKPKLDKGVTISAKPKLKKNTVVHLKRPIDKSDDKLTASMKKGIRKCNSKMHTSKPYSDFEDLPNAEILEPSVSFLPEIKPEILTSDSLFSEADVLKMQEPFNYLENAMTVEANLKMSEDYYIPEYLRDDVVPSGFNVLKKVKKNVKETREVGVNTDKDIKDQFDEIPNKNGPPARSKVKLNCQTAAGAVTVENITPTNNQEKSNIPKALQEFYDEVTRGFDSLAKKSTKNDRMNKKKSALTVDKSVVDQENLVNIVQTNANLSTDSTASRTNEALFFSLESKVILVLRPEIQFSFLGKLKLQVLYGAVELYGSIFDSQNTLKPVEIYSPRGYSSISITTHNSSGINDKEALWDALTAEGVDRSLKTKLHDAIQECQSGWSVLILESLENVLTNFLNSYSNFKLFPKIENAKYPWCDPRRAECILQSNFQFYRHSDEEISITPQWNESVTKQLLSQWNSKKSLCTIITGGKGVGKSTTARYLINNLLKHSKKVVLVDLDPGQAETTPAGSVSLNVIDEPLLGPNFTHLKMPFHQQYLEDVNVSNCISRYIECCKKIVECLKSSKDLLQYPIVVNTMGFCKGIGLDICIFLIKLIKPDCVIQLLSRRQKNNFDFALLKNNINERKTLSIFLEGNNPILEETCEYELHCVNSVAEGRRQFETWNMEPRQQRELVLLSYLSQIIRNAKDESFCNFTSNSIKNIKPYKLPFSSFYVALLKSNISPTHILAAMNGNIVALCGIDLEDDASETDKESLTYPLVVIKPPACTCYGYGIVRGIDMKGCCIYINTPLGEAELRHVNLLAGCSPVPFSLLHSGERQPYAGDRGELPTSREAKRGYFRVDQNRSFTK